jgi:hypothetical protein
VQCAPENGANSIPALAGTDESGSTVTAIRLFITQALLTIAEVLFCCPYSLQRLLSDD